jgi:hypothetical protein
MASDIEDGERMDRSTCDILKACRLWLWSDPVLRLGDIFLILPYQSHFHVSLFRTEDNIFQTR